MRTVPIIGHMAESQMGFQKGKDIPDAIFQQNDSRNRNTGQ